MKKILCICVACLLACFLFGCKGQTEAVETTAPPTEPPIMLTEPELYEKFELVYDDCGGSFSDDAEQLSSELTALGAKVKSDKEEWPKDYETLYKTWRANIIVERTATLQKEYEEIIADHTLYEQGVDGLWETRLGVHYVNYFDFDNDGKQELLLLSDFHIVEIYGEEKGHAVKYCEQSLDVFDSFNKYQDGWFGGVSLDGISIACKDGRPLIGVIASGIFGSSGHHPQLHIFYGLESKNLSVSAVVQLKDSGYILTDEQPEYVEMDSKHAFDLGSYESEASGESMTAEQYQNLYAEQTVASYARVEDVGVLAESEIFPVPRIEVNGKILSLDVAPYASWGVLMAPLRDVLEAVGVAVYANSDASVILASTKKDTLVIANGDFSRGIEDIWRSSRDVWRYCFNGNDQTKIEIGRTNGKTFAPVQEIVGLFGASSQWDSEAKTMRIEGAIPDSDRMSSDELKRIASFDLKQASQAAIAKGHKSYSGSDMLPTSGMTEDFSSEVQGGLVFKNGKAVWTLYAVAFEESVPGSYAYAELYRVDVTSDGTVTAYPDQKAYDGAGQL